VAKAENVPELEHDDEATVAAEAAPALPEPPPATFVQVADREVVQPQAAADETVAGTGQLPTPGVQDIPTTGMPAGAMAPVEGEAAASEAAVDEAAATTAEGVAIAAVMASDETPAAAAMPQAAAAMPGAEVAIPQAAAAPPQTSPAQADALRAAVLQRVAERLPERINATVRDLMQPAIDQAMARLSEEANLALRITLQDIVEQVLREELARQSSETKPH
jgi:ribonuclease E